jgi:hypothetical protein
MRENAKIAIVGTFGMLVIVLLIGILPRWTNPKQPQYYDGEKWVDIPKEDYDWFSRTCELADVVCPICEHRGFRLVGKRERYEATWCPGCGMLRQTTRGTESLTLDRLPERMKK